MADDHDEDDRWLLVRVGGVTVNLQSHETIVRTGKEAGLSGEQILTLCHLADLEAVSNARCKRLRDEDAALELRKAELARNMELLREIQRVAGVSTH